MTEPYRVLSLGAGIDSTTLLLMSEHGELPRLDAAIFADTHAEPRAVYEHIARLQSRITIPIYVVTAGVLVDVVLGGMANGKRIGTPPFFVPGIGKDRHASALYRECTREFKIQPVTAKIRELIGLKPRQRAPKGTKVEQWIGFSVDDLGRTFCSKIPWITNRYPLIEQRMWRRDCVAWLRRRGLPIPVKSSCVFCPYHKNAYWRDMRDNRAEEWQQAVTFEARLQQGKLPGVKGKPYLHRSLIPLAMAPIDEPDTGQEELFCFACNT